mmetsp:Transcript_23361/g.46517  ORF Transcript_23361/g.46517 Transcript_23361/m.46517 type:complete len:269 (-) Transcript_23361:139-945(-)
MPSRKKAKGRARRAAKEAKAKKEEDSHTVAAAADQRQEGSLEAQMQRLQINAITGKKCCLRGIAPVSPSDVKICNDFIHKFIAVLTSIEDLSDSFTAATESTMVKFADVYSSKLEIVVSILLASGTQLILDGDKHNARLYAVLAYFFQQWMEVQVKESKAICIWSKVYELHVADDHTLIQYYRKRISCSCLDKKYEEVKSVKKMGLCYNPKCSLPGRKMQRSKMFYCTRCCEVNYCSVECQKNDWKKHRQFCNRIVAKKAAFNTSKQS